MRVFDHTVTPTFHARITVHALLCRCQNLGFDSRTEGSCFSISPEPINQLHNAGYTIPDLWIYRAARDQPSRAYAVSAPGEFALLRTGYMRCERSPDE